MYYVKDNNSGETIYETDCLSEAKKIVDKGGIWFRVNGNGEIIYRRYLVNDKGKVIYSPKERKQY